MEKSEPVPSFQGRRASLPGAVDLLPSLCSPNLGLPCSHLWSPAAICDLGAGCWALCALGGAWGCPGSEKPRQSRGRGALPCPQPGRIPARAVLFSGCAGNRVPAGCLCAECFPPFYDSENAITGPQDALSFCQGPECKGLLEKPRGTGGQLQRPASGGWNPQNHHREEH